VSQCCLNHEIVLRSPNTANFCLDHHARAVYNLSLFGIVSSIIFSSTRIPQGGDRFVGNVAHQLVKHGHFQRISCNTNVRVDESRMIH
jgi:hypothetical protein